MDVQIRLGDLGIFLLGLALLVLIIYCIIILKNLNNTLKILGKMVEDNSSNINQVLDQAPSIAKNIHSISGDLSHDVKSIQGTIDQIIGKAEVAVGNFGEKSDILTGIMGFLQVITYIKDSFGNFKKKKN